MKNTNDNSFWGGGGEMGDMIFEILPKKYLYIYIYVYNSWCHETGGGAAFLCTFIASHSDGVLYTFLYSD